MSASPIWYAQVCRPSNHTNRMTLRGAVKLTKDRRGLTLAKHLRAVLGVTTRALEADEALPKAVEVVKAPSVKNPFA